MDQNKENMTAKTDITEADGSTRRTFIKGSLAVGAALAVPAIITSKSAKAASHAAAVKIGHLEDLSGNLAVYGVQKDHAAQLAVSEINAGLTLKGGPVGSGGLGAFGNVAAQPPLMGVGKGDLNYVNDGGGRSKEAVTFTEDDEILVNSGDDGILGRPVELINLDGQSNNNVWQQLTRNLLTPSIRWELRLQKNISPDFSCLS